ncbi:MAG: ABC transporter permease [candidate division KSB1 bacterium]|nr:ABC transporter permease [candidate division KSB1 bacterium]MDZ7274338.1 ABC transporter permease [candidate division KSB1 bacterium]MDZ7285000.1 ABC transporter permease [candidate division KSB1 bacterium]MDZ7297579.1 ABC transporter permease [candidate division KSB1 bacterium]MDZ7308838.1 ABC transporter permease [candidate division KSB1 bacterium]
MAALLAALTVAIALILTGIFTLVTFNLVEIVAGLRSRIELEIFVDNGRDEAGIQRLRRQIEALPGVARARYISREEAIAIFRKEFGEGFIDLLASNPLPPSFQITLEKSHQHSMAAQQLAGRLRTLEGVEEVVYRRDFVMRLERYLDFAMIGSLVVGLIVALGSIFVVINHVRLVIHAKRRLIETMQLVGASRLFVRGPFVIQGFVQGLLGGGLASAFFLLLKKFLLADYPDIVRIPAWFLPALAAGGVLLGLAAAHLGVRKYLE